MRRWLFALSFVAACGCGSSKPDEGINSPDAGGDAGPWYDTELNRDTSYLPMGSVKTSTLELQYGRVAVTAYLPESKSAPVAILLPGGLCARDRYTWFGALLASHGIATFLLEPPSSLSRSDDTTTVAQGLAEDSRKADGPLFGRIDLSRILLSGHSLGAYAQSALTDTSTCVGFCSPGVQMPDGVRGLVLFGFHAQNPDDPTTPTTPMKAIEAPWLLVSGSKDGLATPEKTRATYARLQDRPVTLLEVQGMNHFQVTDYVVPGNDRELVRDNVPMVDSRAARAAAAKYVVQFARKVLFDEAVADDLGATGDARVVIDVKKPRVPSTGNAGLARTIFEPFGKPGFDGDAANTDVVATAAYDGATYMLVRNEMAGAGIWRLKQGKVEEVPFPGRKPSLNSLFGGMAVFRGRLYAGISSGTQGGLRSSSGAEVWAYDGQTWTPIAAREADADLSVTVTSCEQAGESVKVAVTPALEAGAWNGGMFEADKANLDVETNDAGSVTLRDHETVIVKTNCDAIKPGATFTLRRGSDEVGFGDAWNKAVMAMAVHQDRLFVGMGLNYLRGTSLWATSDGTKFEPVLKPEFFGTQASGSPISSSITALYSMGDSLYIGAAGTENYGARLAAWSGGQTRWIIDQGAPIPAGLGRDTFQIASMAEHGGKLWLGGFDFNGAELFSLDAPDRFTVHVGAGTGAPRGFGDLKQIAFNLFAARGELWLGTYAYLSSDADLREMSAFALRSANGATWQLSSAHAGGINAIGMTRFFEQDGVLYGVASRGSLTNRNSYGPARLYVVRDEKQL
ncbi:MAG: hypothetical protein ABW133_17395 [Polyangiaceae bacterium]